MTEKNFIEARAAAEAETASLFRIFKQALMEAYIKGYAKAMQGEERDDDKNPARELTLRSEDFSTRTWNVLSCNGIKTFADMVRITKKDYMSMRHAGRKTINEIEAYVNKNGCWLVDE